ncbi:MAG TPA: serine/threonine-protein kinase [Nocardioides sp.]
MEEGSPRALGSRYELRERLGSGAMGEVWRAVDRTTSEHVAAKLLRETYVYDADIVGRFIQERSILLNLKHPQIVQVRDLVVEGNDLAIVMDLVEGRDLRRHLREVRTLSAREAVIVACAVLDALDAAHRASFLHRDIKPDNVLLEGGVPGDGSGVRLSDFGIARLAQESTVQATGLIGTPGYMPPELFQYGKFSPASDVYAAGVLLYELLAGRTPFAGKGTVHTIGNRHVTVEPPSLPVHPLLWTVLAITLAKDPATRLSAAATAQALRDLPDDALDAPPLPAQSEPESWNTAQRTVVRHHVGPAIVEPGFGPADPGASPAAQAAPAGPVTDNGTEIRPVLPGPLEQVPPAAALAAPTPAAPTPAAPAPAAPTPAAPAPAPVVPPVLPVPAGPGRGTHVGASRVPTWALGLVVVVSLLVVATLVTLLVRGGGAGDDDGDRDVAGEEVRTSLPVQRVQSPPASYASGLTTSRAAAYDPQERTVEIDLTLNMPARPGESRGTVSLLTFLPAGASGGCPRSGVSWDPGVEADLAPSDAGVQQSCAWRLNVPLNGSQARVVAEIELDLGAEDDALQRWEEEATADLEAALGDASNNRLAFPLQQTTGVALRVSRGAVTQGESVEVLVDVTFAGGTEPVYDSAATGAASLTDAVRQLGGGPPTLRSCSALAPQASGDLLAEQPSARCEVSAVLGVLESAPAVVTISR